MTPCRYVRKGSEKNLVTDSCRICVQGTSVVILVARINGNKRLSTTRLRYKYLRGVKNSLI